MFLNIFFTSYYSGEVFGAEEMADLFCWKPDELFINELFFVPLTALLLIVWDCANTELFFIL